MPLKTRRLMKNNNSQHPLRKNSGRRKRLPEEQAWESLSEHLKNSIIASARALSAELDAENHPGTIAIDANKRLVLLPFRETPEPGIEEHFDQVCTLDKPEKTGIKRNRRYIVDWHKLFFPCKKVSPLRKKIFRELFNASGEELSSRNIFLTTGKGGEHQFMDYGEIAVEFFIFDHSRENSSIRYLSVLERCGANLHGRYHHGLTLLAFAAMSKKWGAVRYMLRAGVRGDILGAPFDKGDALSMYRASFLHILAEGDCPGRLAREFMGMLMSKHPDTNLDIQHPDTGASPLMEACQSGNLVIARELIRHGADVNLPDKNGQTPLMCCCGEPATFHASLTQAGANPWQRDKLGRSAIVHELVDAPHPYSGLFAMLSRYPVIPEEQQLITLFAAMHAGWDCLGILAAAGLRLDMQARYHGRTLLHELARCSSPWILISLDSEQFLMNFFQPEVMDERGNTPFLEACRYGNFYAAERLLRLGADPLACNRAGLNAWDVLAEALAGIKQQKRKKLCSSRFSDLPQEYGLQEPEEVPQDDDGLYELARLLHAHSIPARHPEKTIAHILAAAERHTLENFPFRTLTYLWLEAGFPMEKPELQQDFSSLILRQHVMYADLRKYSLLKDEAGLREHGARMASILSSYRHAGGKLLFPETMERKMHLWKEISMTVKPPLEIRTYPQHNIKNQKVKHN